MTLSSPFIVYNASAGSGKTFAVVQHYLSILLTAPQKDFYKNILAITFTNKAVAEMKTRIIDNLTGFAKQTPEHAVMFEAVKNSTGLTKTALQQRAQKILKSLLHNYAAFEVSTIDGFTHRILRTFAKDLQLSVNFEVELNTQEILNEAVDRLIAKAGSDKLLTKTLIDFAIGKADDDKSWDITRDLNEIATLLTSENNLEHIEAIADKTIEEFNNFSDKLTKKITQLHANAQNAAARFFELIADNEIEDIHFIRKSAPNYFQKVYNKNFDGLRFDAKWQLEIETNPLYKKSENDFIVETLDKLQPEIASLFHTTKTTITKTQYFNEIRKNLIPLSLLNQIATEVETLKKERNIVLISEFNKKISNSIKNQPAPFIYERLGERYSDYFIDEFQDTSILQWENLIPLINNSLSSISNRKHPGKLYLVGDAKQSIYRWRGGKAEQFMALSQPDGYNPFPVKKEVKNLPNNYRSLPKIIDFNNRFFSFIANSLSFPAYQALFKNAPQNPVKSEGGYVNIDFIEAKNKEEEFEVYPKKITHLIKELSAKGYAKKDMCILVRKKDQGIAIAQYLSQENIPIISSETLLINQSHEVNFINTLLQFSLTPSDNSLKFELLDFLYKHLAVTEGHFQFMAQKLLANDEAFFETLQAYDCFFSLNKFQQLSFYDAVEYSLRSFKLAKSQNAYLQFYLDAVYEYSQKNSGGIAGFTAYWESQKGKLSIIAPEGEDAVQIMTIHKSKGLEFPIVIYPFANENITDTRRDNLWVELEEPYNDIPLTYISASKKLTDFGEKPAIAYQELLLQKELDTFNLFYVALTRSKEQLYILSKKDLDTKGEEKPNLFSGFLIRFLKQEEQWNDEQLSYSFGMLPKITHEEEQSIAVEEETFISSSPESHNIQLVNLSGQLWASGRKKAIEKGLIVHELLQNIITSEDIEQCLEGAILEGLIVASEKNHYRKQLQKIITHPALTNYYSKQWITYTEKEILSQNTYLRLDRLCVNNQNEAVIIDYKTGDFSTQHQQQIITYAKAVSALGYTVKEKLLVYIDDDVTLKNV